ncbi:PIN domain-containing protein [Glycomyces tenuis]|uniref:PIN domain-containing protein n=1 Tax=Glycomyces tenuis TaxID=58116 RepID=UPI000424A122|nr:PIN domain-containing protein [Glycomyces tenuis]
MGRKLILDTGVLIAAERGRFSLSAFAEDDDLAIAAITVSELLMGVKCADERRRPKRQEHFDQLLKVLPVENYTLQTAIAHAKLRVHAKRAGRPRGTFDLIIAATALATGRVLATTDKAAGFDDLPGLDCIVLQP